MVLSSSAYFIFLVAVFFLYWPVARFRALGLSVVLFANYFFYAKWDLFYLGLIPAASLCDFLIALAIDASKRTWVRRALVTLSIAVNLGVLASFKYMPFFLDAWSNASGTPATKWAWVFPLGISFYCFQSLTYTIDVYRRDAKPTRSLLAYLSAVSFFPTTLAGPITRPAALIPQLEKTSRILDPADSGRAIWLIGIGLIKKLLIADYLADNLVNRIFDFPDLYTGAEVLIGVYAYALQLYYDFSGYSDIAIGSALLLGLKLPANFNLPYTATNIADFWRRWHISLSNWLRDYLFFSLPGLRSKSKAPTYLNLFLTMVLGGLWHGASWNFVLWGALHGAGLVVQRIAAGDQRPAEAAGLTRVWKTFATVQFVCFCWIFFRASTIDDAVSILARIGSLTISFANVSTPVWIVLAIALAGHYGPRKIPAWCEGKFAAAPFFAQAAALAALAIALQYVAATGAAPFIYTRF